MKTIIRLTFGLISSLLLSAGLFRAASHFDPLLNENRALPGDARLAGPASNCAVPCLFVARETLSATAKTV